MAKKAAPKKPAPKLPAKRKLTDVEIKTLAQFLRNTGNNVYRLAESRYGDGVEVNDETFERLESLAGIFHCDQCGRWMPTQDKDASIADFCKPCVDAMN